MLSKPSLEAYKKLHKLATERLYKAINDCLASETFKVSSLHNIGLNCDNENADPRTIAFYIPDCEPYYASINNGNISLFDDDCDIEYGDFIDTIYMWSWYPSSEIQESLNNRYGNLTNVVNITRCLIDNTDAIRRIFESALPDFYCVSNIELSPDNNIVILVGESTTGVDLCTILVSDKYISMWNQKPSVSKE